MLNDPKQHTEESMLLQFVDSRTIGLLAAKKNFDHIKEMQLIEKARTSKCRCSHPTFGNGRCWYKTCRHTLDAHYNYEQR